MTTEVPDDQAVASLEDRRGLNVDRPGFRSALRLWTTLLTAGILAGVGSWVVGEAVVDQFKPQLFKTAVQRLVLDAPTPESKAAAESKNAHLAFTVLGSILGLSMGLAGGVIRGSFKSALVGSVLGLALGAIAGLGASVIVVPIYLRVVDPLSSSLVIPLLVHGSIWGMIGAASGLAFAVGLKDRSLIVLGILGGLLGGFLGAGIFEMVATAAFPFDRTNQPLSITATSRLTARFAVTLCVALLLGVSTKVTIRTERPLSSGMDSTPSD